MKNGQGNDIRDCPLCGVEGRLQKHTLGVLDVTDEFLSSAPEEFTLTICKSCELIYLTPIWLFLIYQSYITIKHVQMTSVERWALIPFVLGLGFYVAILKQNIGKKEN